LFGTCCIVHWNLNDCFVKGQTMIPTDDYELTARAVVCVFLEAMEMGGLAEQFPRAIFTIGASAETWETPDQYNLFPNAARLGVAIAAGNVASGVHDHGSIVALLYKDNSH
jgi:hypothetical protein